MKILLVRLRQIGDVVFTTPTIAALASHFPGAQLTYLVEPAAAPVVAGNADLADVIVAPRAPGVRGLLADLALGRRLARERFDIAIDFHGGPRASLLTWLSAAPRRIGYVVAGRSWMYTERVERPRALRARHSVENQWDLLRALGLPGADPARHPVSMPLTEESAAAVGRRLATFGVETADRLVVMHVSAGNPFRRWPIDSFAAVAAALARIDDTIRVVVTSGPSEAGAAAAVIDAARAQLPTLLRERVLACGEFSLSELRALVAVAALYIGGDSGPMHVAATSQVPMVSLYGPTLPARSQPWRSPHLRAIAIDVPGLPCRPCDQRRCEPGDFRCLTRITPHQVIAAATRLLAGNG
ncbi:MAG TPA: glycosyltransferase family 9 protein [Vicinamibacterales bacterium]|nr:glycosyltransferase family 9 protein [Vicinamibacterales bacterium]